MIRFQILLAISLSSIVFHLQACSSAAKVSGGDPNKSGTATAKTDNVTEEKQADPETAKAEPPKPAGPAPAVSSLKKFTEEPACKAYPPPVAGFAESVPNAAGDFLVFCNELFTGFDGKNTFKVLWDVLYISQAPNTINFRTTPPTITVSDPTILTAVIVPPPPTGLPQPATPDQAFVLMTTKKAGIANVTATFGGMSVSCKINVQAYTPEQVALGKTRYASPAEASEERKPCTACHISTNPNAPSHDPWSLSGRNDTDIKLVASFGKLCNDSNVAVPNNGFGVHKWFLTKEESEAMPAYMRSMSPLGL